MSSAERRVYPEVFRCNPELGQTGQELGLAVGEVSCAVPTPHVQRGFRGENKFSLGREFIGMEL